uniref:Uncharacterized protein n=1 Tax=Manihot esculenta TaxID=3983 RepID=A0A2C9U912_MANES
MIYVYCRLVSFSFSLKPVLCSFVDKMIDLECSSVK